MKKNIIFNDSISDYIDNYKSDILEYLNEKDIDPQPCEIEDAAQELINCDWLDLLNEIKIFDNLNNCDVVIRGSLGLWYGRRKVKARFKSLYDAIVSAFYDNNILYFNNSRCALSLDAYHHDGTNKLKFYKVIQGKEKAITINDLYN